MIFTKSKSASVVLDGESLSLSLSFSSVINDGLEDVSEGGDDGVSDVSCDEFPSTAAVSSPPPASSIPQAPPPPNISGEGGCGNTYTGFRCDN